MSPRLFYNYDVSASLLINGPCMPASPPYPKGDPSGWPTGIPSVAFAAITSQLDSAYNLSSLCQHLLSAAHGDEQYKTESSAKPGAPPNRADLSFADHVGKSKRRHPLETTSGQDREVQSDTEVQSLSRRLPAGASVAAKVPLTSIFYASAPKPGMLEVGPPAAQITPPTMEAIAMPVAGVAHSAMEWRPVREVVDTEGCIDNNTESGHNAGLALKDNACARPCSTKTTLLTDDPSKWSSSLTVPRPERVEDRLAAGGAPRAVAVRTPTDGGVYLPLAPGSGNVDTSVGEASAGGDGEDEIRERTAEAYILQAPRHNDDRVQPSPSGAAFSHRTGDGDACERTQPKAPTHDGAQGREETLTELVVNNINDTHNVLPTNNIFQEHRGGGYPTTSEYPLLPEVFPYYGGLESVDKAVSDHGAAVNTGGARSLSQPGEALPVVDLKHAKVTDSSPVAQKLALTKTATAPRVFEVGNNKQPHIPKRDETAQTSTKLDDRGNVPSAEATQTENDKDVEGAKGGRERRVEGNLDDVVPLEVRPLSTSLLVSASLHADEDGHTGCDNDDPDEVGGGDWSSWLTVGS